jgi:hypothetical protein
VKSSGRPRPWLPPKSAFADFRFPPEVIVVAVRWYLRFNLSYRDVVGAENSADPVTWHAVSPSIDLRDRLEHVQEPCLVT